MTLGGGGGAGLDMTYFGVNFVVSVSGFYVVNHVVIPECCKTRAVPHSR